MIRDLTGQRFGRLVVIEPTDRRVSGSVVWRCRCDCGTIREVPGPRLTRGVTRSCGCLAREPRGEDLSGRRFGKLVVKGRAGNRRGHAVWECACDCGNTCTAAADVLKDGRKTSCGCANGPDGRAGRARDLSGRRFGRLVALRRAGTRGTYALWECACDCGNTCYVTSHDLVHSGTSSCGCLRGGGANAGACSALKPGDLAGKRFGRLYAVNPTGRVDGASPVWRCLCDCGRTVEASERDLLAGTRTSCGMCD